MTSRNQQLFERAQRHIPGGVNSPVRAFRSVGGTPLFLKKGRGARVQDADGKWYIDYVGSWGPMILGHAHPAVIAAVQAAAADGLSFGAPTEREVEIADLLCELVPSMDMVRLVSSGTEATMSAIRLARGFTGRDLLIKFEGCYHGHSDSLLVKAGSGALTFGNPSSAGVPADLAQHTLVLAYNDPQQLADAFAEHGDRIAAVIVEPVVGNMNLIVPTPLFLTTMRELTRQTRRRADLRRGDDRLPRRPLQRAGPVRHHARPVRPSARWSAAACRSAPSAAGARSWSRSPRSARSTRPARCPATRSPSPPAWRR